MTNLSTLIHDLDAYMRVDVKLDCAQIDPHMTNGLLVQGKQDIEKIGFGVSASIGLFQMAQEKQCDAIIVHHTFNFPPNNRFDLIFQERYAYLLHTHMSLVGYHFLLDAHPVVGNNVQILRAMAFTPTTPFMYKANPWGWVGESSGGKTWEYINEKLKPLLSPRSLTYPFGPKLVKRAVVISGMGAPYPSDMQTLKDRGIDLFITGEMHEWSRELFRESGIHAIAGGHYATEVFGIQALMKYVQKTFAVDTIWLDLPNDV